MGSNNNGFLDAFFSGSSSTTNPASASASAGRRDGSTVRSRTRRRVSFNNSDDDDGGNNDNNNNNNVDGNGGSKSTGTATPVSRGATPSPHPSRRTSPLPMRRPPRATTEPSSHGGQQKREPTPLGGLSLTGSGQLDLAETSRAAVDLLDSSWSSLQGLASSFLGSDTKRTAGSNGSVKTHTRRKPSRPDSFFRSAPRSIPSSWGPSGPSTPEIGAWTTQEERKALLQAKKREALLSADTDVVSDLAGRHKRRDSSDRGDRSVVDPEQDEGALVYIHNVQSTDTISGVTIRYGCQAAVFRKANGFWPSDNIQCRRTVLLPVESCSVKGRPVPKEECENILGRNHTASDLLDDMDASSIAPVSVKSHQGVFDEELPSNPKPGIEGDRSWKHESWVRIDGFPAAVEIGRVPRRTLGFFPRTRRKSLSHTRSRSPSICAQDETGSPPPRPQQSPIVNPIGRPDVGMTTPPRINITRHQRRRSSIHLSAPGVGTLDSDAIAPGPAPDKLNKFFSQHMPNLAPPAVPSPNQQRASFDSTSTPTSSTSTSLDNLGGMLEGWVRNAAKRAKNNIDEWQQRTQTANSRGRVSGFSDGGLGGDLIELDSGFDARYHDDDSNGTSDGAPPDDGLATRQSDSARSKSFRNASPSSSFAERFHSPSSAASRARGSNVRTGLKDD